MGNEQSSEDSFRQFLQYVYFIDITRKRKNSFYEYCRVNLILDKVRLENYRNIKTNFKNLIKIFTILIIFNYFREFTVTILVALSS